jgi:uncharacterized protein
MIRRFIVGIVLLFCVQQYLQAQLSLLPENDKHTADAKNFVDLLAKKDFSSAVKTFDATMAKSLPQDKLSQVWEQILGQAGEFQNQVATRTEQVQQYDIVYVTCKFKKTDLDAKIVFDKSGKVSGLFFVPTQKAYSYEMPSYAKPDAYKETDVVIGSGKWALPGTLTLPRQKGPFPVIILVHGSGPQDRDETIGANKPFRDLAYGLASKGVAVLRYEKRTKQYAAQLVEIKNDITVEQETVDDAIAAVIYLESVPEIDKSKIFILGHSLGGMLIPMIASKSSQITGFIIMAGTSQPLENVIYEQYKYILSLDGTLSDDEKKILNELESQIKMVQSAELTKDTPSEKLPLGAPASYWLSLKGYEPAKLAAKITKPILILQGERDYQVTMDDYKEWQNALSKNQNVTFKLYKDLNHLFIEGKGKSTPSEYEKSGHVSQKVISDIIDWISRLS